jgi:hypothetical protein
MKASDSHLAVDEEPLEKLTEQDSEATQSILKMLTNK